MKKVLKYVAISLGSLISFVLLFAICIVINGKCFYVYHSNNANINWMSSIKDDTRVNEVVIPGSHDAGTYGILYPGETQSLNFDQQLEIGVRYFDIRVNNAGGKYVIYHAMFNGVEFDPILDSISSFINNHPSEFLLLDFQHFDNGAQSYVFEQVSSKLDGKMVINNTEKSDLEFISDLTVANARGKAIVFFGDKSYADSNNFIFSRNNDECEHEGRVLDSCYYTERNSAKSEVYIEESIPYYINRIKEKIQKEGNKGIFVLQGQLTDGGFVFGPWSKERSHEQNMSLYIKSLPEKDYFNLINVIMRDFVNFDKCNEIILLNSIKGITK